MTSTSTTKKASTARVRRFVFDPGTMFEGMTMRCVGLTIGEWRTTAAFLTRTQLVEMFFERLVEWSMTDRNGDPIPPTMDGAIAANLDVQDVLSLAQHWYTGVTETVDPLAMERTVLAAAETEPLEMEPLGSPDPNDEP